MTNQLSFTAEPTFKTALAALLLAAVLMSGCARESQIKVVEVTVPPQVVEVTVTPAPTDTPPASTTVTVCASGCDFTTIQATIDDPDVAPGSTVNVTDAIHTESEIAVNKDVTIQGQGTDGTIVQAHGEAGKATDRVFFIEEGATATIRGMTIRHGNPDLDPMVRGVRRCGGGIANLGTLALENTVISNNAASGGGGIWNKGMITLVNSAVSDNTADGIEQPGYDCGTGGGIKNVDGMIELINSIVSGNTAARRGGGIQASCAATTVLTNSTISGNIAGVDTPDPLFGVGGGVHLRGTLVLVNSTVSDNGTTSA